MKALYEFIDNTELNYYFIVNARNIKLIESYKFKTNLDISILIREEFLYIINKIYYNKIAYIVSNNKDKITTLTNEEYVEYLKNRNY